MDTGIKSEFWLSDYSLVGKDSAAAIEKGLAEARWYASPVPKEQMRALLERKDGPALRDTVLWFVGRVLPVWPPPMIKAATHMLKEYGVGPSQISVDEF